ncbi:MAG: sigma-70 family RNA polymerase sigma factor [Candidatus Moranbacteria bacterium]|nr:sigma-70 family RNA polymerase sigma factor [Candidatus Moranbacteria bacterium]
MNPRSADHHRPAISDIPSDSELLEQAQKDPEAFGALMERYEAPLRRYLMRLTGWGSEEVSDMLQESFIKAYRHLNDYDETLKFSTWLYRITHNQAIDTLRSAQVRPFLSSFSLEDVEQFVSTDTDTEGQFLRRNDLEQVRQAILDLPILYREVLILRFLEEKSYEEIVDILKKPKGTIATLIKRGRTLLLDQLRSTH